LRAGGDLEYRLGRRCRAVDGGEDLLETVRAVTRRCVGEQFPCSCCKGKRPGRLSAPAQAGIATESRVRSA
jgi:hypothetical protein